VTANQSQYNSGNRPWLVATNTFSETLHELKKNALRLTKEDVQNRNVRMKNERNLKMKRESFVAKNINFQSPNVSAVNKASL
jgi:hypothetical protein